MNLLEYMRAKNRMTQAEWECTFEEDAREILVLLAGGAGAGKRNGFWDISHYFLAYVDCATGGWCQWVVAMSWLNASVGVR